MQEPTFIITAWLIVIVALLIVVYRTTKKKPDLDYFEPSNDRMINDFYSPGRR